MKKYFSENTKTQVINRINNVYTCGITDTSTHYSNSVSKYSKYLGELDYGRCSRAMNRYDLLVKHYNDNGKRIAESIFNNVNNQDRISSVYIRNINNTAVDLNKMIKALNWGINPYGGGLGLSYLMKLNKIIIKKCEEIDNRKKENDKEFEKRSLFESGRSMLDNMPLLFNALKTDYCLSANSRSCYYFDSNGELKEEEEPADPAKTVSDAVGMLGKITKVIGKASKSEGTKLSSDVLKYLGDISALYEKNLTKYEMAKKAISATKTTVDTELAVYKYFEKTLNYSDAEKYYNKYGNAAKNLKFFGSELSVAKAIVGSIEKINDKDASFSEKINSYIDVINKVGDMTIDYAIYEFGSEKAVQKVTGKTVVRKGERVFKLTKDAAKFADNANAVKNVWDVGTSTIKGGINRWEITQEDGYQPIDIAETSAGAATEGLSKVVETASFGIVKFDGKEMTDFMMEDIRSQNADNNVFVRTIQNTKVDSIGDAIVVGGAAFLEAERIIGDTTIKIAKDTAGGIKDKAVAVCDWVKKITGHKESETTGNGSVGYAGGGFR